jgi:hypothetical protein
MNQTLTPNPGTIYFHPFYSTKEGPVVLEIPAAGDEGSITGSVDDVWQTALEDVGPAGVDKGTGGKYLILPPDYKSPIPAGYIAMPSSTYSGYAVLRSNVKSGSDADVAKAVAYGKRIKFYPLAQADKGPQTTFVDAIEMVYDSTIPYDLRFFEALNHVVQNEPWLRRDMAMIDTLKSIGIEKGRAFTPDVVTQEILKSAVSEAHAWLDAKYETSFTPPYFPGTHWALPASPELVPAMATDFANPDIYPLDSRATVYSMAYFSAKHLGTGQYYLMSIKDSDGQPLKGGNTYRLHVPAKSPVTLYWSATVYDRATHALLRGLPYSGRASNTPGLQVSADGSADVYFGPAAPAGKNSNWVPTSPAAGFEVLFRFYGPQKPLFDKTWKLPDIERIAS